MGVVMLGVGDADRGRAERRGLPDGRARHHDRPLLRDIPVPGDYNGNGIADIAIYRRSTGQWFILYDNGSSTTVNWGSSVVADVPVPADYDGDGKLDFGVFRETTGTWIVHLSSNNTSKTLAWGSPSLGDTPIASDFDGDGKADFAVFRATTGAWYIAYSSGGSTSFNFGAPSLGDTVGGMREVVVLPLQ